MTWKSFIENQMEKNMEHVIDGVKQLLVGISTYIMVLDCFYKCGTGHLKYTSMLLVIIWAATAIPSQDMTSPRLPGNI